jgi:type II secretory pathway pseudopilin PulG
MRYRQQGGFGLLGSCLAISVAAFITLLGIKTYQNYQKTLQRQEIAFDLRNIEQVGMDYYTITGCLFKTGEKKESYFAGNTEPSWDEVSAITGEKLTFSGGRDPWIRSYQLKIIREEETTEEGEKHAHYHLVIVANLKNQSGAELAYLGKQLHATSINDADRELKWDRLAFALRGSLNRRYQPLQANNGGEFGFVEQEGQAQSSRQYCR